MLIRKNNRLNSELREVKVTKNFINTADGSVLFELGNTKVICNATIEEKVPPFLSNLQQGWLTAEYSLLPKSTLVRTPRERGHISGRTAEIQRLIGRSLRASVDLHKLGHRTIIIDCDVIQADGGTRTASITGGFIALYEALKVYKEKGVIEELPIKTNVAAISVGIINNEVILDLDYEEDSQAGVDMNFVMTEEGNIIEVQGTGENSFFSKQQLDQMYALAYNGISKLIQIQKQILNI